MRFDYWRERFPLHVFAPTAAALAFAGSGGAWQGARTVTDAAFALGLLAQFRLWDDLADREQDAIDHPSRVLVRTADVANFEVLCTALALGNLLVASLREPGFTAVALLAALDATFVAWYGRRLRAPRSGVHGPRTAVGDLIRLSKYPVFVAVIAAGSSPDPRGLALAMLGVYAAACAYEVWHDPASPIRGAAR
jgi:hypothetical protein